MKNEKMAPLWGANPVYKYEDDKVIFKDGRVAVGFLLTPAEMEHWSPEDYDTGNAAFLSALRVLPTGTVFQKTDIYYERPYQHPASNNLYFNDRMGKHFADRPVLYHNCYVFVSFAPAPLKSAKKASAPKRPNALSLLINKAATVLPDNHFESVAESLVLAERSALELAESCRAMAGVSLKRLTQEEIEKIYLQYFNLEFDRQPASMTREIVNEVGTLAIGEQKASIISMIGQGTEVYPCITNHYSVTSPMLYPLTHFLQCPHILTQAITVLDTKAQLVELDKDRKLNSSLSAFATQDNVLRVAELETFALEVRMDNKQLVDLHLSCMLWDSNDSRRRENINRATAALRSLFASEAAVESYLTLPLYMGILPGNGFQIPDRWIPTSADRAACYVHWTTTYRPTQKGEYLCDRSRNLVRVNMFDTNENNQNSLTIGPSGSGKSFTMGNFIIQRFENDARQILIDVGGSYRNVVQSLNGTDFENTYFEYDPQNPIEFNPFFLVREQGTDKWLYGDEKLNFHLALLQTLWKHGKDAEGKPLGLSKSERTILTRFLEGYYRHLNNQASLGHEDEDFPGMESFLTYVRKHHLLMMGEKSDQPAAAAAQDQYRKDIAYVEMDQFFLVLSEYITGGRYGKVLNARRDRDLSDYKLICFDMQRVQQDPTIYPVVAMLITELSLDLFRKFPNSVKYILMDEAWSMLSGSLQDFIENMYRTIRKTNGSIGIITQGIGEILKSPIGQVLINNSSYKIILSGMTKAELEATQKALGFTSHEMGLLASARKGQGFREFLIKQGERAKIYALEASPQLNAILSSKPEERNYLNELVRHYQQVTPVAMRDEQGKVMTDEVGEPIYTTHIEQRLDFAVDEYVEQQKLKALS